MLPTTIVASCFRNVSKPTISDSSVWCSRPHHISRKIQDLDTDDFAASCFSIPSAWGT